MTSEQLEPTTLAGEPGISSTQSIDASSRRRGRSGPVAILLVATMIWGGTFLVTQNAIKLSGPFTYLFFCFSIGALTLALIFHRQFVHISSVELKGGMLIGFLTFAGYALQTYGLQYTTSSKSAFITGLYVPLVPILAFLFLRQRISRGALIGLAFSLVGLFLISLGNTFNFTFGLGELLTLGSAFLFALQILAVGAFAPRANVGVIVTMQIATTALFSLLAIPLAHEALAIPPLPFWLAVLFMGTIDMGFCFVAMNWAQQSLTSTRASLIYALEPVWAGFFGYLAGQTLSLPAWLGCACMLLGMIAGNLR